MGRLADAETGEQNATVDAQAESHSDLEGLRLRRSAERIGALAAQAGARCVGGDEPRARWGPAALCCRRRAPAPEPQRDPIKRDLLGFQTTQDSERWSSRKGETVALATPPVMLTVQLPDDYEPGMPVSMEGPHGRIEVPGPSDPDAKPGSVLHFSLAPSPDFQVEVPEGAGIGAEVRLRRPDGVEISVPVPKGLRPGDTFNISPPALMVRVPEGCAPGQRVVFKEPGAGESEWCRVVVPEGVVPGGYFAARLPPPSEPKSKPRAGPAYSSRAKGA